MGALHNYSCTECHTAFTAEARSGTWCPHCKSLEVHDRGCYACAVQQSLRNRAYARCSTHEERVR